MTTAVSDSELDPNYGRYERYQTYDAFNRISKLSFIRGSTSLNYRFNYNQRQQLTSVDLPNDKTMSYTYDGLNRLVSQSLNTTTPITRTYGYLQGSLGSTTTVSSLTNTQGTFTYTYDANGNITSVAKNGTVVESYEYDALNQLTEAVVNGTTYEYTYDKGGNLLTAIGNGAKTYTYGDDNWGDLLTAFNGQTITYDGIGNPLQYRDGMSFTWAYGRRVHTLNTTAHTAQFNYNADGYRSQKILTDKSTNTATTHYYDYNGNSLICERWGNNTMWFVYDATGAPLGLIYNGTVYYFVTNLQGDVTGITNAGGTLIAQYTYDPWGKPLSVTDANGNDLSNNATHIANVNPIRYRGYYYDVESGLYYLLSRYYDPVTQRFVNGDAYASTGTGILGFNMFAYCNNNPVNMADTTGELPFFLVTAAIGAVAGAIIGGVVAAKSGGNVWAGIGIGAAAGGLAGAGLGATAGVVLASSATASTAAVVSGAGMVVTAVSTGGAGAGLALVADNISRAVNNVGTVLYSGGEQARQAATTFANNTGGTTIDPTVIGQVADAATKVPGADFTTVWSQASAAFCNQASGVVNAFVSNSAYRGVDSIFWSVEMPTLLNNPKVTEIIIHIFE